MPLWRKPWFSVFAAVAVLAIAGTLIAWFVLRGNAQDGPAAPVTTPVATPAATGEPASPTPSEAASSGRACPSPTVLAGDDDATRFKNRVFDYEEALLISDPQKAVEALETRGNPKGLVTQEKLEQLREDASQAPKSTDGLSYVLDRQQSQYELDDDSGEGARTAYVTRVYLSCRDGKVVNDPVVDTEDLRSSTWVQENGAWRVIE